LEPESLVGSGPVAADASSKGRVGERAAWAPSWHGRQGDPGMPAGVLRRHAREPVTRQSRSGR